MLVVTDKAVVRPDLQQVLPRPRLFHVLTVSRQTKMSAAFLPLNISEPKACSHPTHALG
jgi:hypothetical protein